MLHSWCWDFPFFEDVGLGERAVAADGATFVVVDAAAATTEARRYQSTKIPTAAKEKKEKSVRTWSKRTRSEKNFEHSFPITFFNLKVLPNPVYEL